MGSSIHNRRVVIYARHSTAVQSGSVEGQLDRCRRWVAQQGGRVVAEFADRAKSAATIIGRAGVKELLVAIESGAVDVLVCEDLSRLSRSQGDVAYLYALFAFHGVELHSVAEGAVTPLHIGLKGTMNALLLQDIIDKTHRGLTAVARSGRSAGRCIYGYEIVRRFDDAGRVVRGLRRIHQEEARVVVRIHETFVAGASIMEIARRLNSDGIASPTGRPWRRHHLEPHKYYTGILCQPLYVGELVWNRTRTIRHPLTGKRKVLLRPEEEWERIPVPHLALLDRKLFDRAQARLAEIRRPRKPPPPQQQRAALDSRSRKVRWTVTSGLTVCRACGNRVVSVSTIYLSCTGYRRGECGQGHTMKGDEVAVLAAQALRQCLRGRGNAVLAAVQAHVKVLKRSRRTASELAARLQAHQDETLARLRPLYGLLVDGIGGTVTRRLIAEYEAKIGKLSSKMRGVKQTKRLQRPLPGTVECRVIADRASTALNQALGTMERRPMDEAAVDLVRGAVSRFVVGYAGADRSSLEVVPELDPEAVYLLGTEGRVPRRQQ